MVWSTDLGSFVRLSVTVPLVTLGSISLFAVALTAPSSGAVTGAAACSHAQPSVSSTEATRLAQPTSASDARPLGESLGDGISAAVRSLEPLDATGRPTSGLPYGLSQGVIGVVGSAATGYKVVVETRRSWTTKKYEAAMSRNLPAAGKPLVEGGTQLSLGPARSPTPGTRSATARGPPTRHVRRTLPTSTRSSENVVVEYDKATTSAASLAGLRDLSGVQLVAGCARTHVPAERHPQGRPLGRCPDHVRAQELHRRLLRRTALQRPARLGHRRSLRRPGTVWKSGTNYYGTTTVRTNYPDYDQSLVTGSAYGAKIWTDGPGDTANTRTVTGGGDPGVGTVDLSVRQLQYARSAVSRSARRRRSTATPTAARRTSFAPPAAAWSRSSAATPAAPSTPAAAPAPPPSAASPSPAPAAPPPAAPPSTPSATTPSPATSASPP